MLQSWGIEVTDTEICRYLAGSANSGKGRLHKKEFLRTKLDDEYSESLTRKLWVVPRGNREVDAYIASLPLQAVVAPGLLFKVPAGISPDAHWFVDSSIDQKKLGFGVLEHHTTVKQMATTGENDSGPGKALTVGAGSSGDDVRHPLAVGSLANPPTVTAATTLKKRRLAKVWSDKARGANVKDDFEEITESTLDAAAKGLWFNPDPAVKDTMEFWLRVFSRHMDKTYATWGKRQIAPNDTTKVAW